MPAITLINDAGMRISAIGVFPAWVAARGRKRQTRRRAMHAIPPQLNDEIERKLAHGARRPISRAG